MRMYFLLLLLPVLLFAEVSWKSEENPLFDLNIHFESSEIQIGETFSLELMAHYPSSYELDMDSLTRQLMWFTNPLEPSFNVLKEETSLLPAEEGRKKQHLKVKIAPLITGTLLLSFLKVRFIPQEKSQSIVTLETPVFSFHVYPFSRKAPSFPFAPLIPLEPKFPFVLSEKNRQLLFNDPIQLEKEREFIQKYLEDHSFPWLFLALLISLGGIGLALYFTYDRWPKFSFQRPISPSPQERIQQLWQSLQERRLLEKGEFDVYYASLSSILLEVIQFTLKENIKTLTTKEIEKVLESRSKLSIEDQKTVLSFLKEIDQVKFAAREPTLEEAISLSQRISHFLLS